MKQEINGVNLSYRDGIPIVRDKKGEPIVCHRIMIPEEISYDKVPVINLQVPISTMNIYSAKAILESVDYTYGEGFSPIAMLEQLKKDEEEKELPYADELLLQINGLKDIIRNLHSEINRVGFNFERRGMGDLVIKEVLEEFEALAKLMR